MMRVLVPYLILFIAGLSTVAVAEEYQTFDALVVVPVVEQDRAYAQSQAFNDLRYQILGQAVQELIGEELFMEYDSLFLQRRILKPHIYLESVKVLSESVINKELQMSLEGKVRMELLEEKLHNLHFPMRDAKPLTIGLITENGLNYPHEILKKRLSLFQISIQKEETITLPNAAEREKSGFVTQLFGKMPRQNIIFLLETMVESEKEGIVGFGVRVYRKSDASQITHFFMPLPEVPLAEVDNFLKKHEDQFTALFSIKTLQRASFYLGGKAALTLRVQGLITPKDRYQFELRALQKNRLIQKSKLIFISGHETRYQITAKATQSQVIRSILAAKGLSMELLSEEGKEILILAKSPQIPLIRNLKPFEAKQGHLARISKALGLSDLSELSEEFIPSWTERENNNTNLSVNELPKETLVYAVISSRADQDLYALDIEEGQEKLILEWTKLSRTRLRPVLTIYDQDFNYINSYRLSWKSSQTKVEYAFGEEKPSKVYVRLSDRVGYIPRETGGFLNFGYMLRYQAVTPGSATE